MLLLNIFVFVIQLFLAIVILHLFLLLVNFHIITLLISSPTIHMMTILHVHVGHSLVPVSLHHLMLMAITWHLSLS